MQRPKPPAPIVVTDASRRRYREVAFRSTLAEAEQVAEALLLYLPSDKAPKKIVIYNMRRNSSGNYTKRKLGEYTAESIRETRIQQAEQVQENPPEAPWTTLREKHNRDHKKWIDHVIRNSTPASPEVRERINGRIGRS